MDDEKAIGTIGGKKESVGVKEWEDLCYGCLGKKPAYVNVQEKIEQRKYFSFYDYEYYLDVHKQYELMDTCMDLREGLCESYAWYKEHADEVVKKPYLEYIDQHLIEQ